ncbi:MAG: hypothetical protein HY701_07085 [Gemmatimonadetes bacterium]|nr:hypothetical protein [Gemmatimonadota bacterium]
MNQTIDQYAAGAPGVEAPPRIAARTERFLDDPRKKSPLVAAILSAMPGLGQVYVGYYQQGFIHIAAIAGMIALIATDSIDRDLQGPLGFFMAFTWLYNVIDAARRASLYNQALSGLRPMDLPEDAKGPRRMGSFGGGVVLIGAGLVLFGHTMFGMSLAWVADWWPMALVGLGAWLVYQDRQAKSAGSGRAAGTSDVGAQ